MITKKKKRKKRDPDKNHSSEGVPNSNHTVHVHPCGRLYASSKKENYEAVHIGNGQEEAQNLITNITRGKHAGCFG